MAGRQPTNDTRSRLERWLPHPWLTLVLVLLWILLLNSFSVGGLLMGVVLMSAILSWVNPYAPMAGVINALAEPFLRPFRRVIPLIGGVDLSPIAFFLLLQVALSALSMGKLMLVGVA